MDWEQILAAVLMIGMLIFIWPSAKHWLKNSPKAKEGDWGAVIVPLVLVVGFVIFLIAMV